MSRRKKRANPLRIVLLLAMVAGALYVNQVVVPATPPLFVATATPTRSPESFLTDAQGLVKAGKINQAIETYKEAVKADPLNPAVYVTLARWQVLTNDYEGATENVQNALLLNPNHALARAVSGWIKGRSGDYLDGEGEIKIALELDPNNALAYAYLSEIYKLKIESGKEDFNTRDLVAETSRQAVALDSSLFEVRRARGLALEINGKYEEAIKELEAAALMNENLSDLHLALGRNYKALTAYDKAVERFNRAIALRPEDPEAYAELARVYLTVGDYAKGAQHAEKAVELKPEDPYLHSLLGTLYYRSAGYNEAVRSLRIAVKGGTTPTGEAIAPIPLDKSMTAINLYSRYGLALANSGNCGEALQVSQQISQVVPDDADATYNAQVMVDTCAELASRPEPTITPAP